MISETLLVVSNDIALPVVTAKGAPIVAATSCENLSMSAASVVDNVAVFVVLSDDVCYNKVVVVVKVLLLVVLSEAA